MNRKEYSDRNRMAEAIRETGRDLYPLLKKITDPVKHLVLLNPKRTFTIMFSIALLNTILLFSVIYFKETSKPVTYSSIIKNFRNKSLSPVAGEIKTGMSLSSLFEIKNIRDSLEYLMHKKVQDREDTLCFIRLYKRYSLLDPSIVNALKELKKKRTDSLHLKTPIK